MLVVVDEAQLFAPAVAGEVSDEARKASLGAMTNLMCRGRKRGLAGVIATQRLAKLAKNVAAEASNFLMGRTFLDIDMARAADLLGMERRQAEAFRDLERGQFMALGPALSRRPLGLRIGPTETKPRNATPRMTPLPEASLEDARAVILAAPPPETTARPQRKPQPELLDQLIAAKSAALEFRPEPPAPEVSEEELAERRARVERVLRAVLAEPDAVLATKSWASLEDGTPLVTGEHRGKGLIALFHVSADMRWSDLPMSGAMVEMLRRIVDMSGYTSTPGAGPAGESAKATLAPLHILDGFGAFGPPPSTAKPLPADFNDRASLDHPPGFYGPAEGPTAVNTLSPADRILQLDTSALRAKRASYTTAEPRDLRGILLSTALLLFLIDAVIVALLGGALAALARRRRAAPAAIALVMLATGALLAVALPTAARADAASDDFAMRAVSQTRLAYVVTGNADVDAIVKAGMTGLTLFLAQRTALEAGDPVGVDPAHDELAFFPLIYWPIVPGAPKPPQDAINKIDAYMKQGGTVIFDTRDAVEAPPGDNGAQQTPGMQSLRDILSSLDVPELEPVPREHVLTKTFYLLRDFPGRFTAGQTWVEALPKDEDEDSAARPARGGDGVSPIIITSNDLAGAWALRPDGQAMLPMVPGEPRQREFAFRAGVNIVMYTLTGNYKADQVHAPALIERLGQ